MPGANSLSVQRQWAEDFIVGRTQDGWTTIPNRYDDGGQSGTKMERPALQRLLADVRNGKIDRLTVHSVARLSHSRSNLECILEKLNRHGASLVCVSK